MSKRLTEAINKVLTDLKNISKEEYEKYILCLNGTMNQTLFDKVLNEVKRKKRIDSESLLYHCNSYNISISEFMDVFYYLEEVITIISEYDMFEFKEGLFNYSGSSFKWGLVIGQGSIESIEIIDYNENYSQVKVDPKIKFYKRED